MTSTMSSSPGGPSHLVILIPLITANIVIIIGAVFSGLSNLRAKEARDNTKTIIQNGHSETETK